MPTITVSFRRSLAAAAALTATLACSLASAGDTSPLAIRARTLHTMGPLGTIENGVILVRDGRIERVGPASEITVPGGMRTIDAAVATPGLVDARTVVGLSGIYNIPHDQDQLERSAPIQPELRAIDAYNPREQLVAYVRSFGVTTIHTGHAPGELISGQTCIVKTRGNTIEEALITPVAMVAATVGPSAQKEGAKSPGTRAKAIAMLREEFLKAQAYLAHRDAPPPAPTATSAPTAPPPPPDRNLRLEMLGRVLKKELPLLVTANRAQDIASALRLAEEFRFTLILDSAAESYLLVDEIKRAGVPVILHPTMWRAVGESENLSMETASTLRKAGILVAIQSGFEAYVPKTRVILFEAAIAAANGLGPQAALATITIDAARILGIQGRVGSLEPGKDADIALYNGDPFEYTTQCVGTIIEGEVVSDTPR